MEHVLGFLIGIPIGWLIGLALGKCLPRGILRSPHHPGPQVRCCWIIQGHRHNGPWWPDNGTHSFMVAQTIADGERLYGVGTHWLERRP